MTKTIGFATIVIGAAGWVLAIGAAEPPSGPATEPSTQPSSATYVTTDTTTQGNWKCVYGTEGYVIVGDAQKLPAYAKVGVTTKKGDAKDQYDEYILRRSSAADSALQKAEGSDRIVAHWGSYVGMTIDVNLTDNQTHRVALYCLDYDKPHLNNKIEVLDADTDRVLDTRKIAYFFHGQYLVWDIKGHVKIRVTSLAENARMGVSGLFFGQRSAAPSAGAKYVTTDTTTQGNWKGAYGTDGYVVVGDAQKLPAYAKLAVTTEKGDAGDQYNEYAWSRSTTDVRALQKAEGTDRIAAMWGSYRGMTIDVNLTDNQTHRIALYCLDFKKNYIQDKIEVLDADTCAVLDTRNIKTFFDGQYLVWDIKGHVRIRVTNTNEARAAISGLFFGPLAAPAGGAGGPSTQPATEPAAQPAKENAK